MDIAKIKEKIYQLNRKHSAIITNSYIGLLESLVGEYDLYENDDSILISYSDCGVHRLVFYSNDTMNLGDLPFRLPVGEYILEKADRVGFESDLDLCSAGFTKLKKLDRYANNRIDTFLGSDASVLKYRGAVRKDVFNASHFGDVNRLLRTTFDIRISHLPDEQLLTEQLNAGEFVGVIENSEIVTLLQRRIEKKKFYINQIINNGQKESVHSVLLEELDFFAASGGKAVYSWIEDDNEASIRFHEKYGMKKDGTYVTVYSYRNEEL